MAMTPAGVSALPPPQQYAISRLVRSICGEEKGKFTRGPNLTSGQNESKTHTSCSTTSSTRCAGDAGAHPGGDVADGALLRRQGQEGRAPRAGLERFSSPPPPSCALVAAAATRVAPPGKAGSAMRSAPTPSIDCRRARIFNSCLDEKMMDKIAHT